MSAETTGPQTTDRPASMTAALETVEASSASDPAETTTSDQPASATASPEGTESAQATVTTEPKTEGQPRTPDGKFAKGVPPESEWPRILESQRTKTAAETEARVRQELEQQYTGLKDFSGLDANERAGLLIWHRALNGDPTAKAQIAEATRHNPALAATLQGMLAREQAATTVTDQEPEPDLQAPDGTLVYSAKQQKLRDEYRERKLLDKLTEQLKPLQETHAATQAREASAAYQQTTAQVIAKFAAADPEFNTHKAKVGEVIAADPHLLKMAIGDGMPANPELAIELAWGRVYRSTVLPSQQQQTKAQSERDVLTSLQRTAVAASVNPATAQTGTQKRPTSMSEALAQQGA